MLAAVTWLGVAQAAEPFRPDSPAEAGTPNPSPATLNEAASANLPRREPSTLQPVKPVAPSEATEGDDQLDEIYSLPALKVTTAKLPPDTVYAFLTVKGRLALELKRNPGLRFGPLPGLNHAVALEMQKEERENDKRSAITERVLTIAIGEETSAKELIRLMRAATARPNSDWQTKSPGSR